ncbi:toll/interleukin-1 receptor domain-containing protein [Acidobacterium sp. S8]|uniref:toll/interleukin-1 receptor domain-containing protein n=1 Tax=Acidobacterium sp. S8 TaxID=1641854 RepID=UPI001C208803|nr:toll/interleukin-1 receptor domain-containing protein [Acidobacterium sp. S8]
MIEWVQSAGVHSIPEFFHKESALIPDSGFAVFCLWRSTLSSIFINYRRSDSEGEAGRLFDDLTSHFHHDSIFMDVAAIEPGRDFRKAIDQSVTSCGVLLALIGRDWLESKDSLGNKRLENANDFVRIELASALKRDIPVIPVLVRGARMPLAEQLPDDLKELHYRNAVELTHARWKSDVQVLIRALRPHMGAAVNADTTGLREVRAAGNGAAAAPDSATTSATQKQALGAQKIEKISKELAAYIGPISEVIVKQAAKRCSSVEELCGRVSQEIESDSDRAKFLKACRF